MPKRESQTIEYKSSWQEDYFGWIAGYANAEGGTLYVGVNDDGYVIGVKDTHFFLDTLPNQISSFLGITVSINHGTVTGLGNNLNVGGKLILPSRGCGRIPGPPSPAVQESVRTPLM